MIDFSFVDLRLLFPNITEAWVTVLDMVRALISLGSLIIVMIAEWKLFKKFGEKEWKSIVPYYNTYILYKHTSGKRAFWLYFTTSTLFSISLAASQYVAQSFPTSAWMTLLVLAALPFGMIAAVCSVLLTFRTTEAFGKKALFSVGLLLFYPVFISILGFGKSQYVGIEKANNKNDMSNDDLKSEVL